MDDRTAPFSIEAEAAVLSAMLMDEQAIVDAVAILAPSDMYRDANRRIFEAVAHCWRDGEAVDPVTISARLQKTGSMEAAGGIDYLAELIGYAPTSANLQYHAEIVRNLAMRRKLIAEATRTIRDAHDPGDRSVKEILADAERRVMAIDNQTRSGIVLAKERMWSVFEQIEHRQNADTATPGIPSGILSLDRMTLGLHAGEVTVIAARPSMGKTALAMTIANNAVLSLGKSVLVFSFEMGADELLTRSIAMEARVDMQALRGGRKLTSEEYHRIAAAASLVNTAPLWIDDSPDSHVHTVEAKARRHASRETLDMVVIDYLQLMEGAGDGRREAIDQITRRLKLLAKALGVPLVLLSQLSRGPENRADKRPILSDLRESGGIEQDADNVVMIYRPEYYMTDSQKAQAPGVDGLAELIVPKQRNGPTGSARAYFQKPYARFESLTRDGAPS